MTIPVGILSLYGLCLCCVVLRKQLPRPTASTHVENELDRYLLQFRETQLAGIADDAALLRDTATNVDKALAKLERFLSTLSNLAVEVCRRFTPYT